MHRLIILVTVAIVLLLGCGTTTPVVPELDGEPQLPAQESQSIYDGPYHLWGEWTFYIDETHEKINVVPSRHGRFHLNALKFLEEYCTDCLQITNLKNNGDSTVDLSVKIEHPFLGHPKYTGFDVKGIIMFNGSWIHPGYQHFPPHPDPFRVSWRYLGDPQVLNADGYTLRWSPSYDSGQTQPIFNYLEGKYASGTPTANLNAYLNFYTDENRHMFSTDGVVLRTYHIWLPPGQPVVVGYAVEACWEPPLVTPVTNPIDDFPPTANQPEAYEFYFNFNNGEPVTEPDCCGLPDDPSEGYMVSKQWGAHTAGKFAIYTDYYCSNGGGWPPCGDEWPEWYCAGVFNADVFPNGEYIGIAINHRVSFAPFSITVISYTLFEITIDLE